MGKSFANFMCKKFFHPASFANIKRVWMAEERTKNEQQKQDTLRAEYEREQEIYNNRVTMGDEKVKHGLHFMYEPPKGLEKGDKADGEQEYKFEWQREAPREDYAKNMNVQDQPFGIAVRDVKCIKCHKWGHVNTDRECPMYDKSTDEELAGPSSNPADLMDEMRRDGYALKQSVLGRKNNMTAHNQQMIGSDEDDDDEDAEATFLKTLTKKQKKKLLKKLERLQQGESGSKRKKKHKKDSKKKQKKKHQSSDDSSTDSDSEDERRARTKDKRHQRSASSDSNSDFDQRERSARKRRHEDIKHETKSKKTRTEESSDNEYHHRYAKGKVPVRQEKHSDRRDGHREHGRERDGHVEDRNDRDRHASLSGRDRERQHGKDRESRDGGREEERERGRNQRDREGGRRDREERRKDQERDSHRESKKRSHTATEGRSKDNHWFSLSDKFDGFGAEQRSEKRFSQDHSRRSIDDKERRRHAQQDTSSESEGDGTDRHVDRQRERSRADRRDSRHAQQDSTSESEGDRTDRRDDRRRERSRVDRRDRYSENGMDSGNRDKYGDRNGDQYRERQRHDSRHY